MEEKTSFLEKPKIRIWKVFILAVVFYSAISYYLWNLDPTADHWGDVYFDIFLFSAGVVVWLAFFSQFVLPVSKLRPRLKVVDRLVAYLMGAHGPAIFIENGFVRESAGENLKRGRGVIWLDSASTAVLRTESRFTQTVGPGVHFTDFGEYLAGTHDLHTLIQTIGPDEKDEPFTVLKTHDSYLQIQERRWATSGITRDAIEVVATLTVMFRIKSEKQIGNTQFGYNAENSEKTIRDSITRGAKHVKPVCSSLPAKMAADIWREYLRKVRVSELFEIVAWGNETTLQYIAGLVKCRLSQENVVSLDDFGRPRLKGKTDEQRFKTFCELGKAGKKKEADDMLEMVSCQEFLKLRDMGLEVNAANIKRLIFSPQVEEKLITQWVALWLTNAKKEHELVEHERKLAETAGSDEAVKQFAINAIPDLINHKPATSSEALHQLVRSTFKGIRRNPALLKRTNDEQRALFEIFTRLKKGGTHK